MHAEMQVNVVSHMQWGREQWCKKEREEEEKMLLSSHCPPSLSCCDGSSKWMLSHWEKSIWKDKGHIWDVMHQFTWSERHCFTFLHLFVLSKLFHPFTVSLSLSFSLAAYAWQAEVEKRLHERTHTHTNEKTVCLWRLILFKLWMRMEMMERSEKEENDRMKGWRGRAGRTGRGREREQESDWVACLSKVVLVKYDQ